MKEPILREAEARAKEIRGRTTGIAMPEEYERKRAYVELYLRPERRVEGQAGGCAYDGAGR